MIVITGGAGFIGKHMTTRCLNKYGLVTVIDRASRPAELSANSRLTYLQANASRIDSLFQKKRQSDLKIIHLAAETSVPNSIAKPLESVRSNVGVTCAVLDFARKMDVRSFVFASSAAVYGEKKDPCHESDPPDPRSPYAASKLAGEYYCRVYAKTYGIPVTILRFFNVYGPRQSGRHSGVVTNFLRTVSAGNPPKIYGDGKNVRDFIFVSDVVNATLRVLGSKLPPGVVLNIGSGKGVTIIGLVDKVLRLLDRHDLKPIRLPARQGDIRFSTADISLARRRIGFLPTYDIDDGLRLTYRSLGARA